VLDSLQASILRLMGREVDPLGTITPEQLKAVLKSIEGKYNSLRDENKRLKLVIDEHLESIERLKLDLKEARESMKPRGADVLQHQRDELNSQLEELQRTRALERSEWEAKLAELENKLIDVQRKRMDDQEQREDLEQRHQVELLRLREELSGLETQVSRQVSDTEIRDRLDSEKQTLRARVEELTAERDQLEARLRTVTSPEAQPREVALRAELSGPTVSPQAPPNSSPPSESPDRRELLARLIGGGK
jgi:chromosome segregation ATPase